MTAPSGRVQVLNPISEREWQTQVEAWARRANWRFFHAWQSLHSPSGFPDLCLVRGAGCCSPTARDDAAGGRVTDLLVVRLEPGLPAHRLVGLFHAIQQHPGVVSVADINFLSQATLDAMLLKPQPVAKRKRRSTAA